MFVLLKESDMFYTRGTHVRPIECAWHSPSTKTRRSFVSNWWSVTFSIHNAPDFVSLKECGFLHKRGTRMCPIEGTWYSPYTIHSFVSHWWNVEFSIQKVIVFVPLKECNVLHIWARMCVALMERGILNTRRLLCFVPLKVCNVLHIWGTHLCPIKEPW